MMGCPPSPTSSVKSRRDQVWEMKRERFLSKQAVGGGASLQGRGGSRPAAMNNPSIFGGAPDVFGSAPAPAPSSPLSSLVQNGYAPSGNNFSAASADCRGDYSGAPDRPAYGGCPPAMPGNRGSASGGGMSQQDSFNGNVAEQWSSNVQSTLAQHQQQNDPNYAQVRKRSNGYRVNQAPGGGSSISLTDGSYDTGAMGNPGRGQRAPSPSHGGGQRAPSAGGRRDASPFAIAGRAASGQREASPFAGGRAPSPCNGSVAGGGGPFARGDCGGSVAGGGGPFARADPEPRYGGGGGGRPPVPAPRGDSRDLGNLGGGGMASAMNHGSGGGPAYGGGVAGPAYGGGVGAPLGGSSPFGGKMDCRSSNSYASGANQNCGNHVTDRRTTRVVAPPGGRSQISFG